MHVLFVHQNFPAQFGRIAQYLVEKQAYQCTFVSQLPPGRSKGIERLQYFVRGGATKANHYCSRSFENAIWHSHAIFDALKSRPDVKPDLVIGHSGFLSTVFLRELYACPIVNYFEFFYHTTGTDMDFRPDFPYPEINLLRALARNAVLLMDLESCDLGYSPTRWQRDLLPEVFRSKLRTIFDGVDLSIWHRRVDLPRRVGGITFQNDSKLVTYVARGMESIRGFDIFMRAANLICRRRTDVQFIVVGDDRVVYGGDADHIGRKTFKDWVLSREEYDLSRFYFTGTLAPIRLAELFSITDLHVYLTVPFVLSWSLMNALACGATVLASNTAPVREMVTDGVNGLLTDFFDVDAMAQRIEDVLNAPGDYRHLGRQATEFIRGSYSLEVCLPQMLKLYQDAKSAYSARKHQAVSRY